MAAEAHIERVTPEKKPFSLLKDMYVERGTQADWKQLESFHYKSAQSSIGPQYYRCVYDDGETWRLIAVSVYTPSHILVGERHDMFPKLKPGGDTHLTNVYRKDFINKYFIRRGRIVVDPLYRGVGVSYRFANLSSRMRNAKYIESHSSMSRYNPFVKKAGYKFAKQREKPLRDKGVRFMARMLNAYPADQTAILDELNQMKPAARKRILEEIGEFYYRHSRLEKTGSQLRSGGSRIEGMEPKELISKFIQLVFAQPLYAVYFNPDWNVDMPERIPLLAFDNQPTDEPLRLDLLEDNNG